MVVINHMLLFTLLGSPDEQAERESGFLFPNDFIIFDEAHTLEQVAIAQYWHRGFAIPDFVRPYNGFIMRAPRKAFSP